MIALLNKDLEDYARSKTEPAGSLLDELEQETRESMELPQMLTGQLEGRFLKLMAQTVGARRCLDLGTFTGYSALSIAEGTADDGEVITCEIDPKCLAVARKYFQRSPHGKKIKIKEGPALETIKQLSGPFDLVFLDSGDKNNYYRYYEATLPLLRSGGLFLADNVLWDGRVLDPRDEFSLAIAQFNDRICADERVDRAMLTIRDGVFFIRKK